MWIAHFHYDAIPSSDDWRRFVLFHGNRGASYQ